MGNMRDKPNKVKVSYSQNNKKLSFATCSMCGWRPFMEDAHLAIDPYLNIEGMSLFGIFDGHGGPEVAIFARDNFAKCLANNGHFKIGEFQKALIQAFLQIDDLMATKMGQKELTAIRQENSRKNNATFYKGETNAGCTANVILVTRDFIYCANAGDSRSVAAIKAPGNKLQPKHLSFDHKPENQKQRQRIHNAGGIVSRDGRINNNLNLSRALGDFGYKKGKNLRVNEQIVIAVPDIIRIPRRGVEFILMGCDGIWQRKTNAKMVKWIAKQESYQKGNLTKCLQNLLDQELASDSTDELGMDNMTSILIRFNQN